LRARSYSAVIRRGLARSDGAPLEDAARAAFARLADEFDRVRRVARRLRDEAARRAAALKAQLAALCRDEGPALFMAEAAGAFNGTPGDAGSFRALHALLERQYYRLAFWRVAADEINYRRFFNINELAGVRMENPALFERAHRLIGRMIAEGRIEGLRLDHIDGLFDPEAYCRALQSFARSQQPPEARGPFYIAVEKILARHESLRKSWTVAGTTGYEFANLVNGLFVDPAGERECTEAYDAFVGVPQDFDAIVRVSKEIAIETILAGELGVLADSLDRISERHWSTRDYTRQRLRDALKAVVKHFFVYRTYVSGRGISADDRRDIDRAVAQARRGWSGPDREIFDFVRDALTGDLARRGKPFRRAEVLRFAMRFQQYTGPIMAKSLEDTAFYRHHRLISLNEVGGDPRQFGVLLDEFHRANSERARHWPHTMLAISTHDTKRGDGARLRIDTISEMPGEWRRRVERWSEWNGTLRSAVDGGPAPSANDEYMIYQSLLGAWPPGLRSPPDTPDEIAPLVDRLVRFVVKALREAKDRTSWDNPNEPYEAACCSFVHALLERRPNPFLADFAEFAVRADHCGMLNGLSQTVLHLTVPGVPDVYQGAELWNHSLVDPDNRAPVDFARRRALLEEARSADIGELLRTWADSRIKLRVLDVLLRLRRRYPAVLRDGSYMPLVATGAHADHLVAFVRGAGDHAVLVIAGRLFASLLADDQPCYHGNVWGDTALTLPRGIAGTWRDTLTRTTVSAAGGRLATGMVLADLPVTVLMHP
jgi:(1->4)-alpha-D-glucan 1-alpha-D-glucosylmutase